MSCCPSACGQKPSCNAPMSFCCPESPSSSCEPPCLLCRPIYPVKTSPRPTKTVVYLRPNGHCLPCCPMPCPPKAIITTYPRCEPSPPPPPKKCFICTVKRVPVMPPPPPTPPISSPCRPHVVPCSSN